MYVCLCRAVTDGQINNAVQEQGCCSFREVRDALGVGTQCGQCVPMTRDIINEALSKAARDIPGAA